jgi:hypothetical protein
MHRSDYFDIVIRFLLGAIVFVTSFSATLTVLDSYSPLLGREVRFSIVVSAKPQVCAKNPSRLVFEGKICKVNGSNVRVQWSSLANIENAEPACGTKKTITWFRKDADPGWNETFVGSCGKRPSYFENMPNSFRLKDVEIQSPQQ